jgi:hypothetical protein
MLSLTVSDIVYQWYIIGWCDIVVRRVKSGWTKAKVGDNLKINSVGSGTSMKFEIKSLQYSNTIDNLVKGDNYLKICSTAASVASAKHYVAKTMHFIYGTPPVEGEMFVAAQISPTQLGTTESYLYTSKNSST